ncbi:UNVERIFIED_CONTAM: putative hexokinase-like 2 protein [Sesamum angustifolium]|uniref:Phosphotransferase n=1 Tax=Sesamum angustifolium TaxID=2727405 RepID=A0AAW2NKD3_9LAMI
MKRGVGMTVTAVVTTAAAAVAVAVLVRHWRRRKRYEQARRILRRFARRCATPAAKLWHVADEMASEIEATLSSSDPSTNLRLLVAYLAPLPTGYVGRERNILWYRSPGNKLSYSKARLEGKDEPLSEVSRHEVAIPSDIIAKVECTRVGKELAAEINQALEKHGVDMRVFTVVINVQWGNFSSLNLPLTEYDTYLDAESKDPGSRVFEKLISGMFLGEIVRRVLLKMAQEAALFGDCLPPKLTTPYLLMSPDVAAMHQDVSEDYQVVERETEGNF